MEGVYPSPDEGHATSVAEGSSGDIAGTETQGWAQGFTAGLEGSRDEAGGYMAGSLGVKISVQWGVCRGAMLAEVEHLAQHGLERGEVRIGRVPMSDGLTPDTILLVVQVKQNSGCLMEGPHGGSGSVHLSLGRDEGHIL